MSSKDETDSIFHGRRDRLASEPGFFVPREATCHSNTMAIQSGMLKELNNAEPHSTKSLGRAQSAQAFTNIKEIAADLPTKISWTEKAEKDTHLWVDAASNDVCYAADDAWCTENKKSHKRLRKKCVACRLVAHVCCIEYLVEEKELTCKPTFRNARQRLKEVEQRHHFLVKKRWGDKCHACNKSFSRGYGFSAARDQEAHVCSWCKYAYHTYCFTEKIRDSRCTLGALQHLTVPNSWVVRLPEEAVKLEQQNSLDHSVNASLDVTVPTTPTTPTTPQHKRRRSSRRKHHRRKERASLYFTIKPTLTSSQHKPLLVFINPRSGGNQGAKLMQTFQWLLNPRQVFDLNDGGPEFGLKMFQETPNLRILACGGDGTVGWVLSILDKLEFKPYPPVAVLPLGTGNDLARVFGWGGGYTDEPLEKILTHVEEGTVLDFDRWSLSIAENPRAETMPTGDLGKEDVPLHVINNYFSIGADAQVALDFHESREARPEKFDTRFKNKFFYALQGGKDVLQRKFADLSQHIRVFGDNEEITQKIQALRSHVILLLNIPRYGSGTLPWGNPNLREHVKLRAQSISDGYIEVLSCTSVSLAALQIGGTGDRLGQYQCVRIETDRTLPVQIDGEACRLRPCIIEVKHKNCVFMVKKESARVARSSIGYNSAHERIKMSVSKVSEQEYEKMQYDVYALQKAAVPLGLVVSQPDTLLSALRGDIDKQFCKSSETDQKLATDWCFLDMASSSSTHSDRLYRIQQGQEDVLSVKDMLSDGVLVLEIKKDNIEDLSPATRKRTQTLPTQTKPIPEEREDKTRRRRSSYRSGDDFYYGSDNSDDTDTTGPFSPNRGSPLMTPVSLNAQFSLETQQSNMSTNSSENVLRLPVGVLPMITVHNVESDSEQNTDEDRLSTTSGDVDKELIDASKRGQVDVVQTILEKGANITCTDDQGLTPLHHACRHGRKDVVAYLVKKMPAKALDIVEDVKLQTALHKAAWYGYRTICHTLVEAGASLTRKDYQGNTPYYKAKQSGDKELATYLKEKERKQRTLTDSTETAI
ncbi:diacylglycerol kinase zeta-like isoform X2 [Dysidea avara]|uniref:diacylglycerol kinase zeta-like isoform X2 n=1 Tax=Dysidea avara TaxID=196820 RepID=UPI0033272538